MYVSVCIYNIHTYICTLITFVLGTFLEFTSVLSVGMNFRFVSWWYK